MSVPTELSTKDVWLNREAAIKRTGDSNALTTLSASRSSTWNMIDSESWPNEFLVYSHNFISVLLTDVLLRSIAPSCTYPELIGLTHTLIAR